MLAPQDFEDWPAGLCAGVVWLEYASLIAVRQVAYCGPEAPAEDLLVVCTSQGLLIRDGVRALPALHLSLGVIYKGNELVPIPEVHPVRQSLPDVPGSLDPWCRLQDNGDEHQRPLGVPSAGLNAAELRREDVDEAAAH
jgi:hypothetical protein